MAAVQLDNLLKHLYSLMSVQGTETLTDAELLRRFTTRGEEVAFAALVRRHGPLVLQVCQRLLHDPNTAEDVFQAAFLVLARKANSLRKPETVGSFLYGVAYRLARRARVEAARRQVRDKHGFIPPPADPLAEVSGRELLALLDSELNRLPSKYRLPLVLCCLQGRTRDEVAEQLGLALRTLQRRLEQGRALLHSRLTRRGLSLSVPLLGMLLMPSSSSALPARLLTPTVRTALVFTARSAGLAGLRSARAIALAEGILRTMFVTKVKIAASLMLTLTLLTAGMCALAGRTEPVPAFVAPVPAGHARPAPAAPPAAPVVPAEAERIIKTDDALAAGLQWLVQQQQGDGRWRLNGTLHEDIAATAFALLPLLGAGESPKNINALHPYGRAVERGLKFLVGRQDATGRFSNDMYANALATRAVCEAYAVTMDPALKAPAQRAIDFIVKAQHEAGGWRYAPGQAGDTSSTSYQVRALASARAAGLTVPEETRTRIGKFLDSVASQAGSAYSYTPGGSGSPTMTAAGHLCRLELGGKTDDKGLVQWAASLRRLTPLGGKSDLYYHHYVTLVLRLRGGSDWDFWEPRIRKLLLDKQDQGQKQATERGSWPTTVGQMVAGGRLMTTSLALLTLQTCARTDKLPPLRPRELKGRELAALYNTLSDKDFVLARHALRTLAASPRHSVPFLRMELRPVPSPDAQRIERWIADLNADEFAVRQRAVLELEKLDELAHSALRKALANKPTLEARRRIEQILEATESNDTPAQRQALRAVGVLESIGTADAQRVLNTLAKGAPASRLTQAAKASLERLAKRQDGQPFNWPK